MTLEFDMTKDAERLQALKKLVSFAMELKSPEAPEINREGKFWCVAQLIDCELDFAALNGFDDPSKDWFGPHYRCMLEFLRDCIKENMSLRDMVDEMELDNGCLEYEIRILRKDIADSEYDDDTRDTPSEDN